MNPVNVIIDACDDAYVFYDAYFLGGDLALVVGRPGSHDANHATIERIQPDVKSTSLRASAAYPGFYILAGDDCLAIENVDQAFRDRLAGCEGPTDMMALFSEYQRRQTSDIAA